MTLPLKYPLGIQTFSKIRNNNYLYVDKTADLYDLISHGEVYFLCRPRRFGKSLLISTLEALFGGQKTLFDGLAIADTDYDFATYPVVKLEFSKDEFVTADSLRNYIYTATNRIANHHQIELIEDTYTQRFDELIVKLHQKHHQPVVLLIDEYDKPILNNFNTAVLPEIKQVMSAFYAVIKPLDEHLRFVFITGVSKFSKVSVFSGMNSLTDISMERQYATICGITQQELEHHFAKAIDQLNTIEQLEKPDILAKIKHWYNGYRFEEDAPSVYNPYSLLSLFKKQKFNNYWFTSGTPTFLLNLLQHKQYDLNRLTEFEIGQSAFEASDPQEMSVQSVFVQTGYLTIKDYKNSLYTLDFPNYEVKKSFYESVATRYSHLDEGEGQTYTSRLIQCLQDDNLADFFATLSAFFANIPYDLTINLEKYYQSLFYAV
ncbi:MAG: AAA family ATPase, partial [Psychrosphaera sp.]|nr:AAA family ATPase [Psychrosphaera sp.]